MKLDQLHRAVERRVDDTVDLEDVLEWLNTGQNIMASEVGANFPQLEVTANMDATFVFPEKYHDIPVLYASAEYKVQDDAITESRDLFARFERRKALFVSEYSVPPQYLDTGTSQQFVAVADQDTFTITKESYVRKYGNLKVYVNGMPVQIYLEGDNSFRLYNQCTGGEKVTAVWEVREDLLAPPLGWRW